MILARLTVLLALGLIGCGNDGGATQLLEISVAGEGIVTATAQGIACAEESCRYRLPGGEKVTLVATASPGHRFEAWGGACSKKNACELTMSGDRAVEATFDALDAVDRVQKLIPSGAKTGDKIYAVDIEGDLAIAGMRNVPSSSSPAVEAAYVFERSAGRWVQLERIDAPNGCRGFGHTVAIDGGWALVGAHYTDTGAGTVYFFKREGTKWSQLRIDAPQRAAYDYFGISVALEGTTALVGAPGPGSDPDDGRVHVLELQGQTWKVTGGLAGPAGLFGYSVALDGGTVLVGAPEEGSGAAYTFEETSGGWKQTARLVTSVGSNFGRGVGLDAGVAFVASYGKSFVFERTGSGWTEKYSLPLDATATDVAGNTLVTANTAAGGGSGAVRIARRLGGKWVEGKALAAPDGKAGDKLGAPVAISVTTVITAAPGRDDAASNAGAVYFFELTP